jgi:hypothetical protein
VAIPGSAKFRVGNGKPLDKAALQRKLRQSALSRILKTNFGAHDISISIA